MNNKIKKIIATTMMTFLIIQGNLIQNSIVFAKETKNNTNVTNLNKLEIANNEQYKYEEIKKIIRNICNDLIEKNQVTGWNILNVKKGGYKLPKETLDNLNKHIKDFIKDNSTLKDYSRESLHLLAAGGNPTNVNGINFIERLCNTNASDIYSEAFALITLNASTFYISDNSINTKESLLEALVEKFNNETGWGDASILKDRTLGDGNGMVISALAPYYNTEDYVKTNIDKALDILSKGQGKDGDFDNNSNSTAMVIIGLCDLGIDPTKDERFIKNGKNPIDGLLKYITEDANGFKWKVDEVVANPMSTDQGLRALAAYKNLVDGSEGVYSFKNANSEEGNTNDGDEDGKENQILILENLNNVNEFKLGENAKVQIRGTNNTESEKEATIIVGLFNENNKLENHVAVTSKIQSKESKMLTASLKLPDKGSYNVKILSWDNINDMNSISKEIIIPVK